MRCVFAHLQDNCLCIRQLYQFAIADILYFFSSTLLSRGFSSFFKVKTYQFEHSVKDDQIIRQKLQISNLLILEIVLHVTRNSAFIDAE
jgi:hypothetical protein